MPNISKDSPEKRQIILDALEENPNFASACRKARISRPTLRKWRDADPVFDQQVLAARESGLDALEDALVVRAKKSDTTAAIFLLKSHRRSIYGDKVETTLSGRIDHVHRIPAALHNLTNDELEALESIALKAKATEHEVVS
jgi:transposase-like protein